MNEYTIQAQEIINEWNAMTGAAQEAFCRACTCKAIKGGRRLAHGDELDDAAHSAYLKVLDQLADADKLARNIKKRADAGYGDSLPGIVSRAAKAVLQREINREDRDSVVISDTATNSSGETYSLFETIAGTADTERAATIRATLKDFYSQLDVTSKAIFGGMIQGKTEREMAPAVNLSNVAVHKRISKIRSQLAAALI